MTHTCSPAFVDIAVRQGSRGAASSGASPSADANDGASKLRQEEEIERQRIEAELEVERRRVVANAREFVVKRGHINRRPQSTKERTRHQVSLNTKCWFELFK